MERKWRQAGDPSPAHASRDFTPRRALLTILGVVAAAEALIMGLSTLWPPTSPAVEIFADALLLALLSLPLMYHFLFKPLAREVAAHREARERMRRQNEFLKAIINALPHPFSVIGADDYLIKISNRLPAGKEGEGARCYQQLHQQDEPCAGERRPCPLAEVKRTGRPVVIEHIHLEESEPRYVEVHGYPILDEAGRVVQMIESVLDITDRKRAEELLQEQKRFSNALVKYSAMPTFVIDPQHRVINWNKACEEITGIRADEVLGTDEHWRAFYQSRRPCLADFIISGDTEELQKHYPRCRKSSFIPYGLVAESWFQDVGGERRYILFEAAPIYDSHGELVAVIETLLDITKRKELEEKFEQDASIDKLTGIFNRHKLEELLAAERDRTERYGNHLSVIMMDIDEFKGINDTYGHDVGDAVLQSFAKLLQTHLRKTDRLGRWGGEEFMIVATETTGGNAGVLAEKLRAAVEAECFATVSRVTMSCGVTQYLTGETVRQLLKRVDEALYEAKRGGKNQVVAAEPRQVISSLRSTRAGS